MLASQVLLIAVSLSWVVHMVLIELNGSLYFVENNRFILWGEVAVAALIIIFAGWVLILQIQRLEERRSSDRIERDSRNH